MTSLRISGLLVCGVCLAGIASAQTTMEMAPGISIAAPTGWSRASAPTVSGLELLRTSPTPGEGAAAHMVILMENRGNPSGAFSRLKVIARQYNASAAPTLDAFLLNGFVAIERRYQAPVPQPGSPQADGPEPTFPQGLQSQRVTTAVAVNNWVVRFEGDVYLRGTNASLVGELDTIRGSLSAPQPPNTAQAADQLQELRQILNQGHQPPVAGPQAGTSPGGAQPAGASGAASAPGVAVLAGFGELEVASNDGTHVVIASNSGIVHSTDSGKTYSGVPWGVNFSHDGDPSVAVGASNQFYVDLIGYPPGANGMSNCTNTVTRSTDNGATFNPVAHAVVCTSGSGSTCFPDQEHLAADRTQTPSDQLYNVWRNFDATGACTNVTGGLVPMITCSTNGGTTWPIRAIIGSGDFPRVAVGRDGSVYTLVSDGTSIEINKFSSCSSGLAQQAGFPVQVALYQDVVCPVPGLDRCNRQNVLSSPTVAPDDTNPNHLTVAYATHTGIGNENVVVQDSRDAGSNWSQPVVLNGGGIARRFMPSACATNGTVWVTWYDRRSATNTVINSNTEFFMNSAGAPGLTPGAEQNLSNIPDPQCSSGFACGSLDQSNGTSCSMPVNPGAGRGCPKYGDYNGIGCSGGRVFAAWSSAVAPKGSTAIASGINIYATSFNSSPVSSPLQPPGQVTISAH